MLLAVNVTAAVPATPSNVGVFQAACVAVLTGAYGVSTADALGYGIVLQAVEIATAVVMGMPALLNEGLSWREVRLRALNSTPVRLKPLPAGVVPSPVLAGRVTERHQTRTASGPDARLCAWPTPSSTCCAAPTTASTPAGRSTSSAAWLPIPRGPRAATRVRACPSRSPRPGRCPTASAARREEARIKRLTRAEKLSLLAGAARTTPSA